jgi:hypothetical protein
VPAFSGNRKSTRNLVDHAVGQSVGRILDLFGPQLPGLTRWNGLRQPKERSVDQL